MNGINVFEGLGHTFLTVFISLLPLVVLFLIFQFLYLRLPLKRVLNLFKGIALALLGVAIFLQGVRVGFLPAGREMGEVLGGINHKWILIPLGFLMGFLTTFGEPAVRVLSDQIERTSIGSIRKSVVLYTISVGVALFVGLGMVRIIYGIPLMYIVVPGYILAMALLWPSDKTTICVAFDAGGVATGPMAVTFLLAITVGIASAMEGRDPVTDGFGLIALIALAPILSIMTLGLIVRIKLRKKEDKHMASDTVLIVTIVKKGWGDKVLEASMQVGAEGGTVLFGRGVGIHEHKKIMGIPIEPEKEIVFSVTPVEKVDTILEEIKKAAELEKPGAGLAFVVPVEKVVGVVHLLVEESASSEKPAAS